VPSIFRASLPLYWEFNLPFLGIIPSETEAVLAQSRILFSFGSPMIPGGYHRKNEKKWCFGKNGMPAPVSILFFETYPKQWRKT
jgi:hypothetical protein